MLADADYLNLIQQFGIMGAILVGVLIAVYRAARWIGVNLLDNVFKPLAVRHIAFIERIELLVGEQASILSSIAKSQEKQTEVLEELKRIHQVGHKTLESLIESRNLKIEAILETCKEILLRVNAMNVEQMKAINVVAAKQPALVAESAT